MKVKKLYLAVEIWFVLNFWGCCLLTLMRPPAKGAPDVGPGPPSTESKGSSTSRSLSWLHPLTKGVMSTDFMGNPPV